MSLPTCVASAVTPDADGGKPTAAATSSASSLPPGPPEWTATTTATPIDSCGFTGREPLASSKATNDIDSLMEGLATYEYKVAKRKRGRPRKYEDLSEEERKAKRAVDNRQAAKRSYYRRINKMAELEDKVSDAIPPFARTVACPSQPR